jgi:Patatin-like phospholipase
MTDRTETPKRTRRILTIDGGGLRGVFSAAVIEQIERVNGNRPACEIFDAFVGTSAGAVIAACLAKGMRAREIKQIFIQLGNAMGAKMRGGDSGAASAAGSAAQARQWASDALAELLSGLLSDEHGVPLRADQLKKRFAVVTRNMGKGRVEFMGNFPADRLVDASFWKGRDDFGPEEPVWKMVLRSAALPPLFAPQGDYLDGGISPFANPAYAAYIGVQRCLGWSPFKDELQFFSVGTGYHSAPRPLIVDGRPIPDDALYQCMVGAMMQDINFLQHQIMKRLRAPGFVGYQRYNIAFNREAFVEAGIPPTEYMQGEREIFDELASTATTQVERLASIGDLVGLHAVKAEHFAPGGGTDHDPSAAYIPFGAPDRGDLDHLEPYDPDPRVQPPA